MNQSTQSQLNDAKSTFHANIESAQSLDQIEQIRIDYLGRKGLIKSFFARMGILAPEERKSFGQLLNEFKVEIEDAIEKKQVSLQETEQTSTFFDVTLPGEPQFVGRLHPLTKVLNDVKACFISMGFQIAQGPEIESEYYNFEALNIPKGHPARDMQDTLFIDDGIVLRTHTSPVQVRVMESQKPPIRVISPGRCYRRDTPDATHSPAFHQVEGLCVDEGISFADLKGVILTFAQKMFGSDVKIRFRPSFFPFTEPSAEYDFSCQMCKGKGCRVCKGTGWIEISGAGMVNPAVFGHVNYDSEKYTGFAFGMGLERLAMLMYEVNDIRLFYENDVRFLHQF